MITISIGIPIYRSGSSVEFCIQSALNQSRPADEVIIADNNINRDKKLVDYWTSFSRVKYINSLQNIGAQHNMIRAWRASSSRFFLWLGDDDFLHPEALATYEKAILAEIDSAFIAWCGIPTVHLNGVASTPSGFVVQSIDHPRVSGRLTQIYKYGQWNYLFYSIYDTSRVTIDVLEVLLDWPFGLTGYDWDWSFYVALIGKIRVLPCQTYFYNHENWCAQSDFTNKNNAEFLRVNTLPSQPTLSVDQYLFLSRKLRSLLFLSFIIQSKQCLTLASFHDIYSAIFLNCFSPCFYKLSLVNRRLSLNFLVRPNDLIRAYIHELQKVNNDIISFGDSIGSEYSICGHIRISGFLDLSRIPMLPSKTYLIYVYYCLIIERLFLALSCTLFKKNRLLLFKSWHL